MRPMPPPSDAETMTPQIPEPADKWRHIGLLAVVVLLAMTLWFSATAVSPQLALEWQLDAVEQSWMTMSVQLGFVIGALLSALLNIPDRVSLPRLIAASALTGALANIAIPLLEPNIWLVVGLRGATGMALAGVYPPGMKLVATWSARSRGLGIGIVVGALTLGSAGPHLLNAVPLFGDGGMPPWRDVLTATSSLAALAALLAATAMRAGPYLRASAPFDWRHVTAALRHRPTRLANFGYLGHMWELYAMWTWVPLFILASYADAGWSAQWGRLAGFSVVGIGALGCVLAGALADRLGRTTVTSISMILSGACALAVGLFYNHPLLLTALCLVWGISVVADSAQFSAAVSELTDERYVGTALTIQTCMGFLLTLITIRVIPPFTDWVGERWGFSILALGPLFGTACMLRLRRLPESKRMASGQR